MNDSKAGSRAVDEYISRCTINAQKLLKELRSLYQQEISEVEESISYGIPTFKRFGKSVIFCAGFKNHVSVYPATSKLDHSMKELEKYRTGKGTFQFGLDKPLPIDLIEKYVQLRVRENEEKYRNKSRHNV